MSSKQTNRSDWRNRHWISSLMHNANGVQPETLKISNNLTETKKKEKKLIILGIWRGSATGLFHVPIESIRFDLLTLARHWHSICRCLRCLPTISNVINCDAPAKEIYVVSTAHNGLKLMSSQKSWPQLSIECRIQPEIESSSLLTADIN